MRRYKIGLVNNDYLEGMLKMLIHIAILMYVCIMGMLFYWTSCRRKKNIDVYFVVTSLFPIWIVQTFREKNVGVDTQNYVNAFRKINDKGQSVEEVNWEKGYVLLNKVIYFFFGKNYHFLLGAVSLIILLGIGCFILHNTYREETFWCVFLFVTLNHYFTSMVSLRQYCAMAIGINIYTVLENNKIRNKYAISILLLLFAMSFHSSAIILVLIFLVSLVEKIDKKIIVFAVILYLVALNYYDKIIQMLGTVFVNYQWYIDGRHALSIGVKYASVNVVLLLGKIFLIGLVYLLNEKKEKGLYTLALYTIIGIVFSVLTTKMAIFFRLLYYFDVYLVIFIPKVLNRLSKTRIRRGAFVIVFCMSIVFFVYLMHTNASKCVPYMFDI